MAKAFPSFSSAEKGYNNLYSTMKFTKSTSINTAANRIIKYKDIYKRVEAKTGVPWYFIGAIHMRESNNNFKGVLHNGEQIIGTGRKTKLVPANRGPFSTWEDAAIDAINLQKLQNVKNWTVARMGYEGEKYNGLGYYRHGVNSPYLWAGTNHQQPGKYVADGAWSSTAYDTQLGIMPVIYRIRELEGISDEAKSKGISTIPTPIDSKPAGSVSTPTVPWYLKLLKLLFTKK